MEIKTKRTIEVLRTIAHAFDMDEIPPSMDEIASELGLKRGANVAHNLDMLERVGYIRRFPRKARSVRITNEGREFLQRVELARKNLLEEQTLEGNNG